MPRGKAVPQSGRRSRVLFDCEARAQALRDGVVLSSPDPGMDGDGSVSSVSTAGSVMAGDWIKMRTNLADDPAVIGIADALDLDEDTVVGKLHRLWSWADSQSRDGHAASVTKKWVDRYVRADGFADAMISVGWMIVDKSGVTLPNFDRHNGKTAKTRALSSDRQSRKRHGDVTEESRDERDKNVTREEKRRGRDRERRAYPPSTVPSPHWRAPGGRDTHGCWPASLDD